MQSSLIAMSGWKPTTHSSLSSLRRAISGAKHVVQTHAASTDVVSDSLNHVEQIVEFLRRLHVALLEFHEFRIHSPLVLFVRLFVRFASLCFVLFCLAGKLEGWQAGRQAGWLAGWEGGRVGEGGGEESGGGSGGRRRGKGGVRVCGEERRGGWSRSMGSSHTSIENLVQPNNDNNVQLKYTEKINNQKICSVQPNSQMNTR